MIYYGGLLLCQTFAALLGLGLAGGWPLWAFRSEDRPFLWLAAPLAGLLTLGGSMLALYTFLGLSLRCCLWLGLILNALVTLACLMRVRLTQTPFRHRMIAGAVILLAASWGTLSCNKTSIEARQPTLAAMDGSDMFGYALTADWLRAHPAARPPQASKPFEVLMYANLKMDRGRPLAFFLAAAAGEARGTTSLFSYDWASGVILASAMLGFGGAFANSPLMLVLLVSGAGISSWFANARTGYFAKSIAYPSALLMAALFLAAITRFTWLRTMLLLVLASSAAFSLAPTFLATILGMVGGCYLGALLLMSGVKKLRANEAWSPNFRDILIKGLLTISLLVVAVAPSVILYYFLQGYVGFPGCRQTGR